MCDTKISVSKEVFTILVMVITVFSTSPFHCFEFLFADRAICHDSHKAGTMRERKFQVEGLFFSDKTDTVAFRNSQFSLLWMNKSWLSRGYITLELISWGGPLIMVCLMTIFWLASIRRKIKTKTSRFLWSAKLRLSFYKFVETCHWLRLKDNTVKKYL